jgi:hypothetical protein
MNGTVTHVATRECLVTQPHPATECGIVAARRRCQEEADAAQAAAAERATTLSPDEPSCTPAG